MGRFKDAMISAFHGLDIRAEDQSRLRGLELAVYAFMVRTAETSPEARYNQDEIAAILEESSGQKVRPDSVRRMLNKFKKDVRAFKLDGVREGMALKRYRLVPVPPPVERQGAIEFKAKGGT